jgi:chromosome segregation ATPase
MNILPYRLSELFDDKSRQALFEDVIAHFGDHHLTALLWAIHGAMQEDPAAIADLKDEIDSLNDQITDLEADISVLETALEEQRRDADYWREQAEAEA